MELIALIGLAVLGILGATLSKLLSDEFKAWAPSITKCIVKIAVRQLSTDKRDRFAEEWSSHVDEIPGDISKLVVALGFLLASWRMSSVLFDAQKRALDVFFAAIAAVILFPFLILIALAIKLESPGPIFFRQIRVGRRGQRFQVIKFRTMKVLTDAHLWQVKKGDARITRVGGLLRRLYIDEIPQLFNILSGDMSFIGPRPLPLAPSPTNGRSAPIGNDVKPGISSAAKICIGRELKHFKNWLKIRFEAARRFLRKVHSSNKL
jgi:lipopolysaccharide/colanic/teichoic acid biosynthesis glycosyltransferase